MGEKKVFRDSFFFVLLPCFTSRKVRYLLVIIEAEVSDLLHREHGVGVTLVHDAVGHALLVDLPVVDLLLETAVHHETVYETRLSLPVTAKPY